MLQDEARNAIGHLRDILINNEEPWAKETRRHLEAAMKVNSSGERVTAEDKVSDEPPTPEQKAAAEEHKARREKAESDQKERDNKKHASDKTEKEGSHTTARHKPHTQRASDRA